MSTTEGETVKAEDPTAAPVEDPTAAAAAATAAAATATTANTEALAAAAARRVGPRENESHLLGEHCQAPLTTQT